MSVQDDLMSLEEFKALSEAERIAQFEHWRQTHTVSEIRHHWDMYHSMFYKTLRELNVPTRKRSSKEPNQEAPTTEGTPFFTASAEQEVATTGESPLPDSARLLVAVKTLIRKLDSPEKFDGEGFQSALQGTFQGKDISRRLQLIAAALEDDSTEYQVKLLIRTPDTGA